MPLTEAAQGIADMQGAGMVRSLREAASLDSSLATQVGSLAAPMTRAQMLGQIDGIINTWADTSGMDTSIEAASDKGYLLKYLAPGTGKTATGQFWVYRHAEHGPLYDWHASRANTCL